MRTAARPRALERVACLVAVLVAAATTSGSVGPSYATGQSPCGVTAAPSTLHHIVWIWMENRKYIDVIGNTNAPYETQVAKQCGTSTAFYDNVLPSMPSGPNYLAYVSGGNCTGNTLSDVAGTPGCITKDVSSAAKWNITATTIFEQVTALGLTWKSYNEAMPSNCALVTSGNYVVRHNPAPFFRNISSPCVSFDVPFPPATCDPTFTQPCTLPSAGNVLADDIAAGTLPTFATITPQIGNDMHSPGTTKQGDNWLSTYLPLLIAGPNYLAGDTAIFVAWDEGSSLKKMPFIVIAPSVPAGRRSTVATNQVGVLWNTQELLGLPHNLGCTSAGQGCAPGSTNDFTTSFNLK